MSNSDSSNSDSSNRDSSNSESSNSDSSVLEQYIWRAAGPSPLGYGTWRSLVRLETAPGAQSSRIFPSDAASFPPTHTGPEGLD